MYGRSAPDKCGDLTPINLENCGDGTIGGSGGGTTSPLVDPTIENIRAAITDKDYETALAMLEEFMAFNPDNSEAYGLLAFVYVKLERYDEAIQALHEYDRLTKDAKGIFTMGQQLHSQGDVKGAEAYFTAIITSPVTGQLMTAGDATRIFYVGAAYGWRAATDLLLKKYDVAWTDLAQYYSLSTDKAAAIKALWKWGNEYLNGKNYLGAVVYYQTLHNISPLDPGSAGYASWAWMKAGYYDQAQSMAQEFLRLSVPLGSTAATAQKATDTVVAWGKQALSDKDYKGASMYFDIATNQGVSGNLYLHLYKEVADIQLGDADAVRFDIGRALFLAGVSGTGTPEDLKRNRDKIRKILQGWLKSGVFAGKESEVQALLNHQLDQIKQMDIVE